jgi:hypothetical protein
MNAKKVQISCMNLHAVYVLPSHRFCVFSSQKRVLHVPALQSMLILIKLVGWLVAAFYVISVPFRD